MELSVSPIRGTNGVEAGSEVWISACNFDAEDGTRVFWKFSTTNEKSVHEQTAPFKNSVSQVRFHCPKSPEYPLNIFAECEGDKNYLAEIPIVSGNPVEFSVNHTSNVTFEGVAGYTRVELLLFDQVGNPATDHIDVTVILRGMGKLHEVDSRSERTSPIKDGKSVFYLNPEATVNHDRYDSKILIRVDGPSIMFLNLRTMSLCEPQQDHIVFRN